MRSIYFILTLLFTPSLSALADEHPMGEVVGDEIHMSSYGHGIAGKIADKLIFGHLDESSTPKTSTLKVLKDDFPVETSFTNTDGVWGGTLKHNNKEVRVKLVSIDRTVPAYIIDINGTEYSVKVEYDSFQNNHFINPKFTTHLEGKEVSVKFTNGQSCWMYTIHLIFMIYGSYML